MLYYRYQNTLNLETSSYYVDLENLYEDYIESGKDNRMLSSLFEKYKPSLSLRDAPAETIFQQVISCDSWEAVDRLTYSHKLNGIFGWRVEDFKDVDISDLIDTNCELNYSQNKRYLVIYEGILLLDEADLGCIFEPLQVIAFYQRY